MHLHRQRHTFYLIQPFNRHYLLKNNSSQQYATSPAPLAFVVKIRSTTAEKQHKSIAHTNQEAISHLEASVQRIQVDNSTLVPKTAEYEPYALSKARQIISRSPHHEEEAVAPFQQISFDLIQMQPAYSQDKQITHLAYYKTSFNLVFTHPHKSNAPEIIKYAIRLIQNRFKAKIVFFRTNRERTLSRDFQDFLGSQGITLETSAPYTPAQNGHAERLGGVLLTKARAMRIRANLPQSIWPEIIKAASYICNRTPVARLNWKTPLESAIGIKPNLSHLRAYGYRAYALRQGLARTQKLVERAHIGHLVSYDSTNIYRIQIPS